MAYCDKCGAYIPDGQLKCLACGYDPGSAAREERDRAAAAAYQQEKKAEQERARAEEERRRKMDEDRRWAEKEYARRKAERIQNERSQWESAAYNVSAAGDAGYRASAAGNKLFGILSYFSFLFVLPFIFAGEDKFCRFHGKQGLALFVFSAIADSLSATPFGWIMQVMRIYMMVKGIISAANGRCEPLPFIGKYFEK